MRTQLFPYLLLLSMLVACKGLQKSAEISQTKPSTDKTAYPAIMVRERGDSASRPLSMSNLEVDVQVIGNIATTTLEMAFFNKMDRVLEGQLYIPLGEGQTVSAFAMEVGGSMREGVVVEKTKGRQVFENIVRQQIDPGLLEWTQGNNFRARIYPIPARGSKRIRVSYQQELIPLSNGLQYLLPMNFPDPVRQFSIKIHVFRQSVSPVLQQNELSNLKFESWQDAWVATWEQKNYLPDQQLGFVIPRQENPYNVWVEETGKGSFWYTFVPVGSEKRTKPLPQKITLLWDVSHSARTRKLDKELEVLDGYFKLVSNASIQLVTFAHQIINEEKYAMNNGNWSALRKRLQAMPYDGGTQLGCLDLNKYACDEFILSSDGLSNLGKGEIKLSKTPVMVIASGQSADFSHLSFIAQSTGGEWLNLSRITQRQALEQLSYQSLKLISVDIDQGRISEIYPSLSTSVRDHISLAGKILSQKAEITLNFGFGQTITHKQNLQIDKLTDRTSPASIPRLWAQKKLAELNMHAEANRKEMIELGKSFSVLSPYTSLIVLDRVEDYVANEILPPSDLIDEYQKQLSQLEEARKFELMSQLDLVAEGFLQRRIWWETEFENPGGKFVPDTVRTEELEDRTSVESDDFGADPPVEAFVDGYLDELSVESKMMEIEGADEWSDEISEPDVKKIQVKAWDPDLPYMQELKAADKSQWYSTYLRLKNTYAQTPAFFLDVSQYFFERKEDEIALRVLGNIAELELENHELLRVLARRLEQLGYYEWAIALFEHILDIREEEPQSYRDLALALARNKQYQEGVEMMYEVVRNSWADRFPNIGVLAAHEMNVMIARSPKSLKVDFIDPRLLADLPTDIRVVLDWDANDVDMDLWVTDPRGEKCYYQNRETTIGGFMSDDFTGGYGPEEFLIKKAISGTYNVQVNYYGTNQQRIAGPTNIQVKLITDYGRPNQQMKEVTMRLAGESEVIAIGEIDF